MDAVLPQLLAFPPHPPPAKPFLDTDYDKHIGNLINFLDTLSASRLTGGVSAGGDLLDILDPSINTLPYLYVLLAHIGGASGNQKVAEGFAPGAPLWLKMVDFMNRFDSVQIRYAGNEMRRLMELTAMKSRMIQQQSAAIAPFRTAILRIDPSGSTFTSSHLNFVGLCLEARAYADALPVLDSDIYYFPAATEKAADATVNPLYPYPCSNHESSSTFITPGSGLSSKLQYIEHLQYFLYGAMIYMGLKDWDRAVLFLEIVISSPTVNTASKIQTEAFKKWVLVGLLHKGRMLHLPRTINSQATRMFQGLARPYTALAEIFTEGIANEESATRLIAEAQAGHEWWYEDFNFGLVHQVIAAYRRFSVRHLEETYAALTIADITRRTSHNPNDYAETGHFIIQLISYGHLNATISKPSENPETWVVRFATSLAEGPQARSEEQQYDELVKQTQRVKSLMKHVREADRKLGLSKEYIQEAKRIKKGKSGEGNGEEGNPLSNHGDLFDHDEDMMGDL